ncbi:hypothetical protein [Microbacterium pygmaeum]|uniref:hypothetical protein n=1 Tax=Microbacterium pygmaeum TaxID=370764 RepID=UPI000B85FFD1|nr:hypothetical protein [Microbacterium pygmaeum]
MVSIQGEELPPLYYDWVIDGEPVIFKQSENQDDIRLTQVPHPSKTLEVVIGSGVPPADLVIATFEHVDANGVPTDSGGMQTDCLREVDRCDLIYGPDSLTVTLEAAESAQVVVLQLLYAARNPDGDGMIHMNASWGVRLDVDR